MTDSDSLKQYAYEMLRQLGGREFISMTGAYSLTYATGKQLNNPDCIVAIVFFLPKNVFNKHNIKRVEMCLMGSDTYTFKFYTRRGNTPFDTVTNVYCDQVKDIFELRTGLLVSMHNRLGSVVVVGENV